jgi:RNA 3'-terminal phosphate cyclase (ATP)
MNKKIIEIDGSFGEGGGQILRSSLTLSAITGTPFKIKNIRSGRKKPGLMRQHLTCVKAVQRICSAFVIGAEVGSQELEFYPESINAGKYKFVVGTAGSTSLVFQTILPVLFMADDVSHVEFEGGTHNPMAPPFDYLDKVFLPTLLKMGIHVNRKLERYGFYPAGGGRFSVDIYPINGQLNPLEIVDRGVLVNESADCLIAFLRNDIAQREMAVVQENTGIMPKDMTITETDNTVGPGNVLYLTYKFAKSMAMSCQFGVQGVRAETVALKAIKEMHDLVESGAAIDAHLADQLIIPFALAGSGRFSTVKPSLHTKTNIEVVKKFLDVAIEVEKIKKNYYLVHFGDELNKM